MNELRAQYSKLSDNELLIIVYFESSDYTEEAIKIAKSILDERGLSQPSEEILREAKKYKKTPASDYDVFGDSIFKKGKLKQAVKKRDYLFIGKWLFWFVIFYGVISVYRMGPPALSSNKILAQQTWLPILIIYFLEIAFTIAIFGIIPILFFLIYSLRLSPEQRKEKGLTLFMPKYVFFTYGVSLLIFISLIILPRL